ncbi:hypothetical protein Vadar_030183 [Vaccinium darrowii]|uniref:Uncharacterized protein n=1 Tax=Vaccinium darrowii TaxID=229202 RepID=A0ACB7XKV9_9ERIC|nr:hypothetical protein Vadar_030183 [Vaccinium darrowii]
MRSMQCGYVKARRDFDSDRAKEVDDKSPEISVLGEEGRVRGRRWWKVMAGVVDETRLMCVAVELSGLVVVVRITTEKEGWWVTVSLASSTRGIRWLTPKLG